MSLVVHAYMHVESAKLKEAVLWGNITWSANKYIIKQNIQAKQVYKSGVNENSY